MSGFSDKQDSPTGGGQDYFVPINDLPMPVIWYDADGQRRHMNSAAIAVMQAGSGDTAGPLSDAELLCAETLRRYASAIREVAATGAPCSVDLAFDALPAGERPFYSVRLSTDSTLKDRVGVLAVYFDVTDFKRAEMLQREREAFLELLLDTIPVPVFSKDRGGRYCYLNAAFEEFIGAKREQFIGRSVFDTHPPELARIYYAMDEQLFRDGGVQRYESKARSSRNDEYLDVAFTKAVFHDRDGNPAGLIGATLDITQRKRAEQELKKALDFAQGIIAAIPDLLFEMGRDGRYLNIWTRNPDLLVSSRETLIGKTVGEVLTPQQAAATMRAIEEADLQGVTYGHTIRFDLPDGSCRWFEHSLAKKPAETPAADTFLMLSRDVTERKALETIQASREREFRTLVEHSPDSVARYDKNLRRLYVNPSFAALVEGGAAALIGKKPSEVPGGPNTVVYEKKLSEVLATGKDLEFELKWKGGGGREFCHLIRLTPELGANGRVATVLAVGRNITELHASREKIHRMAYYDTLTALPNRDLFNDRLRQAIAQAREKDRQIGVMMIDMDRFKGINDTLGHAVGDELLREAAGRLGSCVRPSDTVARLGGDEFAVLLSDVQDRGILEDVARTIVRTFDERFILNGREVFVSCSIGIALYPTDSAEADDFLKYADSAMYLAKRSGRRGFRFYSKELTEDAIARLALESELRHAIERGELELHYQPKVVLGTHEVIGSEALLRWRCPDIGLVPPDRFISIAEETGLITVLGEWVLREACRAAVEWNAGGEARHKVAVNLSARQFQFQDFAPAIGEILVETGCRPEWLELEITESLLLEENEAILGTLSALKSMGFSIAIDDFGTGYSALGYLTRFPIDTLKIDRSFVQKVTSDRRHAELVRAILSIARCLGQQVVAEGVETAEQAAFLVANGCGVAQGFLYSKPLPKAEIASLPRHLEPNAVPVG